jgi:hypothetical protein
MSELFNLSLYDPRNRSALNFFILTIVGAGISIFLMGKIADAERDLTHIASIPSVVARTNLLE